MNQILKFKTTLSCHGCKSTVAPYLNEAEGISSWDLDLKNADKILTVHSVGITHSEVKQLIENAGYGAEELVHGKHSCH
jgi:copper chaperone CopZ